MQHEVITPSEKVVKRFTKYLGGESVKAWTKRGKTVTAHLTNGKMVTMLEVS